MTMSTATKTSPTQAAYTVAQFRKRIPLGHTKTCALIGTGQIRSFKIGSKRLIPASEVDRIIEEGLARAEDSV
jgi:hypothetical protein